MARLRVVLGSWHPFSAWNLPASMAELVRERVPDVEVVHLADPADLAGALAEAEVFAGSRLDAPDFRRAPRLRWIHSTATGVRQYMYPELVASPVVLTNARSAHAAPMAEHAVGMLLGVLRRIPDAVRHQAAGRWGQQAIWDDGPPRELAGLSVLLVGLGAVGREIVARLQPFGVALDAVTRTGRTAPGLVGRTWPADGLDDALAGADVVVIAAPETSETHHLFDAARIARMKAGAMLLNVARGSLVDEAALSDALARGHLGAAALDVTEREPLPEGHPLFRAKNLLLTPHVSAVSDRLWQRQGALFAENLARFLSGAPLLHVVDKLRGY